MLGVEVRASQLAQGWVLHEKEPGRHSAHDASCELGVLPGAAEEGAGDVPGSLTLAVGEDALNLIKGGATQEIGEA